jgi:hypothetical protein
LDTEPVTVLQNFADERKTEKLDDAMWVAGISCRLANHTPLSGEMEDPNVLFSVNTFLHLVLSGLHLFRSGMKGAGRIVGNIFKLKTRGRAILSEEDYRTVISIPAGATIVLVGGNIDEDPFVKIRHMGRVLLMLAEDLRGSGELLGKSALFVDQ